jgi:uncharacterized protein with PIN domain
MTELRFAADAMMGGLAKWLRLLGFDTHYLAGGPWRPDPGRILVTRRTGRPHQPRLAGWSRVVRLTSTTTQEQLKELTALLPEIAAHAAPLTRCSVCNASLHEISREEAAGRVPDYVLDTQTDFRICPGCGRVYWPATHRERIAGVLEQILD